MVAVPGLARWAVVSSAVVSDRFFLMRNTPVPASMVTAGPCRFGRDPSRSSTGPSSGLGSPILAWGRTAD